MPEPENPAELTLEAAITKAGIDLAFRRKLLANPRDALREVGVEVPENVNLTVHEFSVDDHHIFLPPLREEPRLGRERPAQYAQQEPLTGNTLVRRFVSSGFVSNRLIQT